MRLFRCQACGQTVFFENLHCGRCGHRLGYLPEIGLMSAFEPAAAPDLIDALQAAGLLEAAGLGPASEEAWVAALRPGERYRFCGNAEEGACNWVIPSGSPDRLCRACSYNRRIPDLEYGDNLELWRRLELAKRRLLYSLLKLELPMPTRADDAQGLAFDFLADPTDPALPRVVTGHANGLITIALREADDVEREAMRKSLGEPYRTLLGHFRHEIGHYFWNRLVRDGGALGACRALFGDERRGYAEALRSYYDRGPLPGWQDSYISAYATMHPWEDFAETWAHYLHMVDTLETAAAHGVELHPRQGRAVRTTEPGFDPYRAGRFDPIVDKWLPLALAANSLNRSMGLPDLYPFVLTRPVIRKLCFIHDLVQQHRRRLAAARPPPTDRQGERRCASSGSGHG
ncbi:MAG TPA: putative zinc-binding peptidase [Acetobacteraceae bacterium]|nr:putative zinc-binding peptidase [Acetobacteraceae bacterium]